MSNANDVASLAARLGWPISEVTLGVAGRTADTEPGNWVFAYHVDGISGGAILEAIRASKGLSLERRLLGGARCARRAAPRNCSTCQATPSS